MKARIKLDEPYKGVAAWVTRCRPFWHRAMSKQRRQQLKKLLRKENL